MTHETSDTNDAGNTRWYHLAYCIGIPLDYFFEGYESDEETAKLVDEICSVCPVREACLDEALEQESTGAHGGWYLENGRVSETKNRHKPKKELERAIKAFN